jgi:hypothetical protein
VLMSAVEMWNGDKRLQTQVLQLAQDTVAIRSLDYDRDRFDIEFGWAPGGLGFILGGGMGLL